jgi:TRAP-type C4-dicarboxylate transport system substrate-binding protein
MKKAQWMVIVLFLFSFLGFSGPSLGNAREKAVKLNFACFFPAEHAITRIMDEWCKEVGKRTNGKVEVTLFPGGILTTGPQTYASVIGGVADIGVSFNGYTVGRFPLTDLLTQPLGFKDTYQAGMLTHAFYKKFKPKEHDEVKVLWLQNSPLQALSTKKPIKTMADVKGLKTRAGGGPEAAILKALGAVPVAIPTPEVYDAVQKGALDAVMHATEQLKGFRLGELFTHHTYFSPRPAGAGYVVMNKQKWNALPPDVQKIMDQMSDEYAEKLAKLWNNLTQDAENYFVQRGGIVSTLSKEEDAKWVKAVEPLVSAYAKELNAKGLPGDEALKYCREYIKTH